MGTEAQSLYNSNEEVNHGLLCRFYGKVIARLSKEMKLPKNIKSSKNSSEVKKFE